MLGFDVLGLRLGRKEPAIAGPFSLLLIREDVEKREASVLGEVERYPGRGTDGKNDPLLSRGRGSRQVAVDFQDRIHGAT